MADGRWQRACRSAHYLPFAISALLLDQSLRLSYTAEARPRWRNGIRGGLKNHCPHGCAGSTPALGTTTRRCRAVAFLFGAGIIPSAVRFPLHRLRLCGTIAGMSRSTFAFLVALVAGLGLGLVGGWVLSPVQ